MLVLSWTIHNYNDCCKLKNTKLQCLLQDDNTNLQCLLQAEQYTITMLVARWTKQNCNACRMWNNTKTTINYLAERTQTLVLAYPLQAVANIPSLCWMFAIVSTIYMFSSLKLFCKWLGDAHTVFKFTPSDMFLNHLPADVCAEKEHNCKTEALMCRFWLLLCNESRGEDRHRRGIADTMRTFVNSVIIYIFFWTSQGEKKSVNQPGAIATMKGVCSESTADYLLP